MTAIIDSQALINCFQQLPLSLYELNNEVRTLNHPSFNGLVTQQNSFLINFATLNKPATHITGSDIQELKDIYQQKQLSFSLVLSSEDAEILEVKLMAYEFDKIDDIEGLVLEPAQKLAESKHDFPITEMNKTKHDDFLEVFSAGFSLAPNIAEFMAKHIFFNPTNDSDIFLAWDPDSSKAISFGSMIQLPGGTVGLLNGAATLEEYRGQGIYKTLVNKRLERAEARGFKQVTIQAMASTSAPICRRHGFEKFYDQALYAITV